MSIHDFLLGYTAGSGQGGSEPVLEPVTATPSTTQQVILPPEGADGISQATVSAVTKELLAQLDADFVAGNIKQGVDILGLLGTLESGGRKTSGTITANSKRIEIEATTIGFNPSVFMLWRNSGDTPSEGDLEGACLIIPNKSDRYVQSIGYAISVTHSSSSKNGEYRKGAINLTKDNCINSPFDPVVLRFNSSASGGFNLITGQTFDWFAFE